MNMGRDNRPECRYGAGCYQKNPDHKNKFKHPDKNENEKENKTDFNPDNKKRLAEEDSNVELEKKVRHDMSSEEESSDPEVTETSNENKENSKTLSKDEVFNDLLPISPQNVKDEVKQKFLLGMPEDFYDFHQFCKSLDQNNTNKALSSVGLELGGPFEVLSGTIPTSAPQSKQLFESHHRYYYDPPEMQTVIVESKYKTGLHIGYFRDIPEDLPVFVCSSVESEGPRLCPLGDNLFSGLYNHLASKIDNFDPFTRTKASALMEKIKLWVNKSVMEGSDQLNLERKTAGMKNRDKKKVATTLHGAGLVVPYDKKTEVGYREIPETTTNLKKIIRNVVEAEAGPELDRAMDVLQELVTNVQFANDEGDPGMGLELGLALLCQDQGKSTVLDNTIRHLMGVSYDLLDRDIFTTFLNSHLAQRTKGNSDRFVRWRKEDK